MTEQLPEVAIRRAHPSDAERIAAFVDRAQPRGQQIASEEVLARFGTIAFLLAEANGEFVGLLGWQLENLVARVTDFLIFPPRFRLDAGRALLIEMEGAAQELQCEVAILLTPSDVPQEVLAFWETFGYGPRKVAELPRAWREVAWETGPTSDQVILKQLRADRVMRPF
jgi:dephospho-CoA kinase